MFVGKITKENLIKTEATLYCDKIPGKILCHFFPLPVSISYAKEVKSS